MTPYDLYNMHPQEVHHRVSELRGCYYNHVPEVLDLEYLPYDASSPRIAIRVIKRFDFDYRRYWQLATVWFDGYPVMIIQNAGREGDDWSRRFITDPVRFKQMCVEIASLIIAVHPTEQVQDVVDPDQQIDNLTTFYGNSLDGYFERY